MIIGHSIIWSA